MFYPARPRSPWLALTLVFLLLLAAAANAGYRPDEIIVKYKPGNQARVLSAPAVTGARVLSSIDQIGLHTLKLPQGVSVEDAIELYQKDPRVQYAGPNHIIRVCLEPNDEFYVDGLLGFFDQWGLYSPYAPDAGIDAPSAWDITTGSSSIVIAIIDTGIESPHEDLWAKVVPGRNVITGAPDPNNAEDDFGHGTFVAGVAAAMTNNYIGVAGVSWGSKVMSVKALDDAGYGTEADAATGIVWAADHGAKIINMSFAGDIDLPAVLDAVEYAWGMGCVLVAASGNEDSGQPLYPAYYDHVIAVGATNEYRERCTPADWGEGAGSNYGDHLDVMAPGDYIVSATTEAEGIWGPYTIASGTSAAAPFVAGIAALLWSQYPTWTNTQVVDQIKATAQDIDALGWDQYTGWGLVNAYQALSQAPVQTVLIGQTNSMSGGTTVRLRDCVITSGSADIPGRMYVEQPDRACAIQLPFTTNPAGWVEGDVVEVAGTVMTVNGERSIQGASLTRAGTHTPLKPIALPQRWIGGGRNGLKSGITGGMGTNNVSLLVTVYGKVTVSSLYDYFYIDDGTNRDDGTGLIGLKISCGSFTKPAKNSFVRVTGISSIERPFGPNYSLPVLRVRRQSDIRTLP